MEGHRAGGQEGQRGLDVQDFHPARDSGHRSARQAVWRGLGEARQTRRRSSPHRQERQNDDSQNFLRRRRQRLREGRWAARNLQSRKIAARRIELQGRRSRELISTDSHRRAPQGTETRITSSLLLFPVPFVTSFLRLFFSVSCGALRWLSVPAIRAPPFAFDN